MDDYISMAIEISIFYNFSYIINYLTVTGTLGLVRLFFDTIGKCCKKNDNCECHTEVLTGKDEENTKDETGDKKKCQNSKDKDDQRRCANCSKMTAGLLSFANFIWMIAYSVYVFRNYKPDYENER